MVASNIKSHFQAIWRRALNAPSLCTLTPELIRLWAEERGLDITRVEERDVGIFAKIPAIVLTSGDIKACFPKIPPKDDPNWKLRRDAAETNAALWAKMEWFSPAWIPNGSIGKILADAKSCSRERAIELFNYHTSTLYTVPFQAACIAQILPQARSLKEFCPLAREAFLAFYSGYRASSISALIPAIEGGLTRIVSAFGNDLAISTKIDRCIDRAIETAARLYFENMWAPQEYFSKDYLFCQDERVFIFETFRRWLQKSFFQRTGDYNGVTWLNRHMFAHGTDSSWQQSANFCRLVVALATLALVESWHDESHRISFFFPDMNEDSKLLWHQGLFQAEAQMRLKLIEQQRYQKHGRLVPEMPTDDGALLRQAILSEDCIKDLVRPLRDAGWKIEVGEPDQHGLYVTVVATADSERFKAALIHCCATDNAIYRKLAETCDAILYRGAPYHQKDYAYGIKVHVGPVTGWQPPMAPNRKHVRRSHLLRNRLKRLGTRATHSGKVVKQTWEAWHNRRRSA